MKLFIASISVLLMVGCSTTNQKTCAAYAEGEAQNEQIIASQKEMPKCKKKGKECCAKKSDD